MKTITFTDNKGNTVKLPSNMNIKDLVQLGIEIKIEPVGTPLKDNWFEAQHKPQKSK